ncbi:hypothetical protein APSETT445_001710 [Aspergillus pseudonomiae]
MGQRWIQSHRGTSGILQTLLSFGLPWASFPNQSTSEGAGLKSDGNSVELPDRFVSEACIAFCKCGKIGLIYPIADMSLLEDSVKTAYSPPNEKSLQALSIAKALVLSFVAFCSVADRREHILYPVNGERCAFEAESLLSTVHDLGHSIDTPVILRKMDTRQLTSTERRHLDLMILLSSELSAVVERSSLRNGA